MPDFAAKLERCLEALNEGRNPQRILRGYPQDREQLINLIRVAGEVSQLEVPGPEPAFKLRTRNLMLASAARRRAATRPARGWFQRPVFRLATALALSLTLVGGGLIAASAQSLPGNPLYGVKRGAEQVQLALTLEPAANARLRLDVAHRRLVEAQQLGSQGRVSEALGLITTYKADVTALGRQVATTPFRPADADDLERAVGEQQAEADSRLNAVATQFAAHGQGEAAASVKHSEHQADEALAGTRTALHGHATGGASTGRPNAPRASPEPGD